MKPEVVLQNMSDLHDNIDSELESWIAKQRVFFVATAPLAVNGHVNVSPKGGDAFRVLGPMEVAYQDYTGSGAETAAHLRENGPLSSCFVLSMDRREFCDCTGTASLSFQTMPNLRLSNGISRRIRHSRVRACDCGTRFHFVRLCCALLEFLDHRDALEKWAGVKGPEKLKKDRLRKNQRSIDGLPAFDGGSSIVV